MKSYLQLLDHVMTTGRDRTDRTGTGTRSVFGYQWRHNLNDGFPLLTTKKVFWKAVVVELLWFLRGDTNVKYLHDYGVTIWDEWADADGNLGPVYGKQWRDFAGVDQIKLLLRELREKPDSRRHIVSAWNPVDVPSMKLPPCHTLWQCYVDSDRKHLSLHLYARSIDSFLGLPFNIASYALLLTILAEVSGLTPWDLVISFGDLHIYKNHFEQVKMQLARTPKPLPRVDIVGWIRGAAFDSMDPVNFALVGYNPEASIKAPIAV